VRRIVSTVALCTPWALAAILLLGLVAADKADPPAGPLSVLSLGAKADGTTDDRDAIARACAAGGVVVFPRGTYWLSRSVEIQDTQGLTIRGEPGAVITYPSDDPAVTAAGTALSDAMARAAFCLVGTKGVRIEGLSFKGGGGNDITANLGPAVYARQSEDVHLRDCRLDGGGSLFQQDREPSDLGARLTDCVSVGARVPVTLGSDAVVSGCRFEQPETVEYDRLDATHGSSHGIYVFAGRRNVIVRGCTFRGIRTMAVKASGSSLPIRGLVVTGNVFTDCGGGVLFGADDEQEHSGCVITGNLFRDCATNRRGWNDGAAIQVFGSRGVVVSANQFDYTRENLLTLAACRAIIASPGVSPLEDLTVTGNSFTISPKLPAGGVLVTAIEVTRAGRGNPAGGNVSISTNMIGGVAGQGVSISDSLGVSIDGNTFRGPLVALALADNPGAAITGNLLVRTPGTSGGEQLRVTGEPPLVRGNVGPWTYRGVTPDDDGRGRDGKDGVPGATGPQGATVAPGPQGQPGTPSPQPIRKGGTATIPQGKTTVTVEHGLGGQPAPDDVGKVVKGMARVEFAGATAKTLTFQTDRPAPAGGITFTWSATRQP
jgi:hypothetical protein